MAGPTTKTLTIQSGNLGLEAALYFPGDVTPNSMVVVCHPHPQRGGDMSNNVVMTAVRTLLEIGIGALTFNFRGVGMSEGSFDSGQGEQDDVRAALSYCRALDGVEQVGLAGYSFGGGMAASVVDESVSCLALISPPVALLGRDEPLAIKQYRGPVLIISGDADQSNSPDALRQIAATFPGAPELQIVARADHFWWRNTAELSAGLRDFFARNLGTASTPSAGV